jgi:hypothetical protein
MDGHNRVSRDVGQKSPERLGVSLGRGSRPEIDRMGSPTALAQGLGCR